LEALSPVVAARPHIRLHILGRLTAEEQILCEQIDWIIPHSPQPLNISRAMQAGANALLLATPPDSHALPGKFAEYAMTGRPVIAIGGGSWRSLLPGGYTLCEPRDLLTLKKDSSVPICEELSVDAAADRLIQLLEST
jgi:hypothetical protein